MTKRKTPLEEIEELLGRNVMFLRDIECAQMVGNAARYAEARKDIAAAWALAAKAASMPMYAPASPAVRS